MRMVFLTAALALTTLAPATAASITYDFAGLLESGDPVDGHFTIRDDGWPGADFQFTSPAFPAALLDGLQTHIFEYEVGLFGPQTFQFFPRRGTPRDTLFGDPVLLHVVFNSMWELLAGSFMQSPTQRFVVLSGVAVERATVEPTSVPEPETLVMLLAACGLVMAGFPRRQPR